MTSKPLGRLFAALVVTLLACGTPTPTDESPATTEESSELNVNQQLSAVEKLTEFLGGREAIERLTTLSETVSGTRFFPGEEYALTDPTPVSNTYTARLQFDVAQDASRLDVQRGLKLYGVNVTNTYSEIVRGPLATVVGSDHLFGLPGGDLLPAGTAALRKERRLTNPFLIVRDILKDPSLAQVDGVVVIDGIPQHRLVVRAPVQPVVLYVSVRSGRLTKLTTRENDHLFRDTNVSVTFSRWVESECGLKLPSRVTLAVDDRVIADETRSRIQTNVAIDPSLLTFPSGANPVFAQADADFGERDFHFHTIFASFGFRLDPIQNFVDATQLAPGVFVLGGASHKSMAVEQTGGVVIIEAPLYAERSQAILAWVAKQFPGKRVTHVVSTHFHDDHSGGLRDFVAAGATVVCGAGAEGYYEKAFAAASTIVPDALALNPTSARIVRVPAGGQRRLADATNPIVIEPVANSHAADMVIVRLPQQNLLFESDLFSPGFPPGVLPSAYQVELHTALVAKGHTSDLIVGGHGGNAPFSALEASLP